jgi:hypothetical protein
VTAARERTGTAGPARLTAQHIQTADRSADQRVQAARSVSCSCQAQPGQPCIPAGDHLARYLHAEQSGAITRQSLTQVIADLDVIAPHVLIQPPGERIPQLAGEQTADLVIRAQPDARITPARSEVSVEATPGGQPGHPAPVCAASCQAHDGTAATCPREAGELEAGG